MPIADVFADRTAEITTKEGNGDTFPVAGRWRGDFNEFAEGFAEGDALTVCVTDLEANFETFNATFTGGAIVRTSQRQSTTGAKIVWGAGEKQIFYTPIAELFDRFIAELALKATITYVDGAIATLIGTAGAALDTLGEISDAINDDANIAATLTTLIGTKATGPASATDNAVARFDGVTGKLLQNSGVIVDDLGNTTIPGTLGVTGIATFSNDVNVGSNNIVTGLIGWPLKSKLFSNVNGQLLFVNHGLSAGVLLDWITDETLKLRNRSGTPGTGNLDVGGTLAVTGAISGASVFSSGGIGASSFNGIQSKTFFNSSVDGKIAFRDWATSGILFDYAETDVGVFTVGTNTSTSRGIRIRTDSSGSSAPTLGYYKGGTRKWEHGVDNSGLGGTDGFYVYNPTFGYAIGISTAGVTTIGGALNVVGTLQGNGSGVSVTCTGLELSASANGIHMAVGGNGINQGGAYLIWKGSGKAQWEDGSANSVLSVDATNRRVGVGIASPTVPLDVVGAALFSSTVGITGNLDLGLGAQLLVGGAGARGRFSFDANGQFSWKNGSNTTLMQFDAATTSLALGSTSNLHVPGLQVDGQLLHGGGGLGGSSAPAIFYGNTGGTPNIFVQASSASGPASYGWKTSSVSGNEAWALILDVTGSTSRALTWRYKTNGGVASTPMFFAAQDVAKAIGFASDVMFGFYDSTTPITATMDVRHRRTAAKTETVDDGAGGACAFTITGFLTTTTGISNTGGEIKQRANGQIYWDTRTVLSAGANGELLVEKFDGTDLLKLDASQTSASLASTACLHVYDLQADGAGLFSGKLSPGPSTFLGLPSASANTGAMFRLTDRGQKIVQSDGTDWRFIHDNSVAS